METEDASTPVSDDLDQVRSPEQNETSQFSTQMESGLYNEDLFEDSQFATDSEDEYLLANETLENHASQVQSVKELPKLETFEDQKRFKMFTPQDSASSDLGTTTKLVQDSMTSITDPMMRELTRLMFIDLESETVKDVEQFVPMIPPSIPTTRDHHPSQVANVVSKKKKAKAGQMGIQTGSMTNNQATAPTPPTYTRGSPRKRRKSSEGDLQPHQKKKSSEVLEDTLSNTKSSLVNSSMFDNDSIVPLKHQSQPSPVDVLPKLSRFPDKVDDVDSDDTDIDEDIPAQTNTTPKAKKSLKLVLVDTTTANTSTRSTSSGLRTPLGSALLENQTQAVGDVLDHPTNLDKKLISEERMSVGTTDTRDPRKLKEVIDVEMKKSEGRRLGMSLKVADSDSSQVLIKHVEPGSSAAKAGLEAGDNVIQMNRIDIGGEIDLRTLTTMIRGTHTIQLRILRAIPDEYEYKSDGTSSLSDDLPDMSDVDSYSSDETNTSVVIKVNRKAPVRRLPREQETPDTDYWDNGCDKSSGITRLSRSQRTPDTENVMEDGDETSEIQESSASESYHGPSTSRKPPRILIHKTMKEPGGRSFWKPEEDDLVLLGVRTWGSGNWATIKDKYFKDSKRTNVNIKDRARLLIKRDASKNE